MNATVRKDLYEQVTQSIIAMMEEGMTRHIQWKRTGHGLPCNHQTGIPYQGVNVLLLWAEAMKRGYATSRWLTYKQAAAMGGQVRKGEKSLQCVFFGTAERKSRNPDEDNEATQAVRVIRPFWLFNLDQIDGLTAPQSAPQLETFQQMEAAEQVLSRSGAVIREAGDQAFYRRSTDEIHLPQRNQFASEIEFYSVALHELTHWTGAEHRLARDFTGKFGSEAYAFEELVAELGSAFLNAELGFFATTIPGHAGYIESWLKVLKNDKRAIFTAASAASKAHRYVMDLVEGVGEQKVA